jgi:Family of unknown function (DUF6011)
MMVLMSNPDRGTTRCLRCGRNLTAAASVTAGYGRMCKARIIAAAKVVELAGFTAAQRDKAAELIGDKGIVPTGLAGVWRTVSSKGDSYYLTDIWACNCRAGRGGRPCYHRLAARILAAAAPAWRAA